VARSRRAFACERRDQLSRLVLVDSFGLSWNRPSPRFALPLFAYIARPTERTRIGFLAQCFVDFDGLRGQMAETLLSRSAPTPSSGRAQRREGGSPQPHAGVRDPSHPEDVLMRIAVPTALIWGRHDLQTRLSVAEAASVRYGWPLQVIEGARDDPFFEQP
jgi:pimeloyl-ACP methyl ester carboxylesterase